MNIYRTVFIMAVIMTPGYALASVYAQEEDTVQVEIAVNSKNSDNGKFYVPEKIRIEVGTTVEWTNLDDEKHTVTDGTIQSKWGRVFDSEIMKEGDVFKFTFNEPGEYAYLCALHPWMLGRVTVLPEAGSVQVEVSFTTDRTTYVLGESVSVTGSISPLLEDRSAMIEVLNPSKAELRSESIAVKNDGTFTYTLKLEGDLAVPGSYTVKVTYSDTSIERTFVVEEPSPGVKEPTLESKSADVRVAAKKVRDFFIIRVRNSADSGASVYGLSFDVPDHVIEAFRGPRDWSKPTAFSAEVRSSTLDEPLEPGKRVYFKLKVEAGDADAVDVKLIRWTAYDSSESVLDDGDTKPISRRR